jgi:hypothetical protein
MWDSFLRAKSHHSVMLRLPGKLNDRGTVVSRHSGTDSVLSSSCSPSLLTSSTDVRRSLQLPNIQTEVAEPKNAFAFVLSSLFVGEQRLFKLRVHPPDLIA